MAESRHGGNPSALTAFRWSNSNHSRDGRPRVMKDKPVPDRKPSVTPQESELAEARLRQQAIGVRLRHMFDEVVNEPVPDEFLSILKSADDRNRGGT